MEERTARAETKLAMAMPCEEEEEPKAQHDERCKSRPRVFKRKISSLALANVFIGSRRYLRRPMKVSSKKKLILQKEQYLIWTTSLLR